MPLADECTAKKQGAKHLKVLLRSDSMSTGPEHAADGKIILQRFQESWKDSVSLTLQGIIYYVLQHFLRLFALDHLLFVFRHDIQQIVARLTGEVIYFLPLLYLADFTVHIICSLLQHPSCLALSPSQPT